MENNETYVWALDLSLSSTGICIFTNNGQLVKSLTIDTTKEKETKLKLKLIGNTYIDLMKKYTPSVVVIEQGFILHNLSSQATFRTHGITNFLFCEYLQIYYPPATVKKTITGRGNAKKEEVRDCILKAHSEINFGSMDESDAYAVGQTYFNKNGIELK
jgi:Holliday junction resolvasome RuvABC endonuclease subunit